MTLIRLFCIALITSICGFAANAAPDDGACPCTATDPVDLVVPELARAMREREVRNPNPAPETQELSKAKVLVLGDSLGLCGFGKTLDSLLRKDPLVDSVYSYLACGTVPISWLKTGPLAHAHTACGFWSIEGRFGEPPAEVRDTYGMQRTKRPDSHVVPKLETLLEQHTPDILVIQNGTNLLSLFADGKTILHARHDAQIRAYLQPFVQHLVQKAPSLKKVYWVGPPVSGRVTPEVQDFLIQKLGAYESPFLTFIDSRALIKYPYRNTMPDKEHFIGRDMNTWAQGVFNRISKDLSAGLLAGEPLPREKLLPVLNKAPMPDATGAGSRAKLSVKAKLIAKSEPLVVDKILPYQESMVSFLYHVDEVISGEYPDSEIVVMHPAHIRLKPQPLSAYTIGGSFKLDLLEFDGSPWESIKRSEQTGHIELRPFIRKEDEARFPSLPH